MGGGTQATTETTIVTDTKDKTVVNVIVVVAILQLDAAFALIYRSNSKIFPPMYSKTHFWRMQSTLRTSVPVQI
jgi:hypothetical protein